MTERLTQEAALAMAVAVAADTATSMGLKAREDATRKHWADNAHPVQSALAAIGAMEARHAAEIAAKDATIKTLYDDRDGEREFIASLRAENARVRAALKPFAEAIDPEHALPDDLDVCLASCGTGRGIKIGHYRDARAALTDTGAV